MNPLQLVHLLLQQALQLDVAHVEIHLGENIFVIYLGFLCIEKSIFCPNDTLPSSHSPQKELPFAFWCHIA